MILVRVDYSTTWVISHYLYRQLKEWQTVNRVPVCLGVFLFLFSTCSGSTRPTNKNSVNNLTSCLVIQKSDMNGLKFQKNCTIIWQLEDVFSCKKRKIPSRQFIMLKKSRKKLHNNCVKTTKKPSVITPF